MEFFVGGLAFEATAPDLAAFVGALVEPDATLVITDRATGRSKGFGFFEVSQESLDDLGPCPWKDSDEPEGAPGPANGASELVLQTSDRARPQRATGDRNERKLYPEHERPNGADSEDWTPSTLEAVDATIRQALDGNPQVRTEMRTQLAWVLLTGDPRTGFEVIGTFSHLSGAEAHASSWTHTNWWPLPLLDRLEAPAHRVTLLRA